MPADPIETLYRECLLAYTVKVMDELGGQFVPARDLRAIFSMGYEAGQTGAVSMPPKKKRRKPDYSKIAGI